MCEAFLVWMVMEDLAPTLALTQIHDVSTTVHVPEWSLATFAHLKRIVLQKKRLRQECRTFNVNQRKEEAGKEHAKEAVQSYAGGNEFIL